MIASSNLSVNHLCSELHLSTSSYYRWKSHDNISPHENDILKNLQSIAAEFPKYGYRRITKALQREGMRVNHKRVRRIMKENNLLVRRKKFKPITTNSNHDFPKYRNLVQNITPTSINQVWVADITYIWLLKGFVYLATIMDLFSRRCVGWALSRNPDTQLTIDALNMVIGLRGEENVKECIHHSDRGVQYAAYRYVQRLTEIGMRPSMGEVGNSYENAHAESFFKTLKTEEVYMNEYKTIDDVYRNIKQFIEEVYNKKRLHSSIGYKPPLEFEQETLNTTAIFD